MIEVIGFYAKGAQLALVKHEFNPATFGSDRVLHELGHSPKGDENETKKPKAHKLKVDGQDILVLNAGHKYVVKHSSKNRKDLTIDAKNGHQVVALTGRLASVHSGDDEIEIIS